MINKWFMTISWILLMPMAMLTAGGLSMPTDPAELQSIAIKCHNGDNNACAELVAIAKTNSDPAVRSNAVKMIIDQSVLAEILKTETNKDVRYAIVWKLGIQPVLAEIAKTETDTDVRWAAVCGLHDQTLLAQIAKTDKVLNVRLAAVNNLIDLALLAKTAKAADDLSVREAAAQRIPGQAGEDLLREIHKLETERDVRNFAAIAGTAKDTDDRIKALQRLTEVGAYGLWRDCRTNLKDFAKLKPGDSIQIKCSVFTIVGPSMNSLLAAKATAELTAILQAFGFNTAPINSEANIADELLITVFPEQHLYTGDILRYSCASCSGVIAFGLKHSCCSQEIDRFCSEAPETISGASFRNPLQAPFEKALGGWLAKLLDALIDTMHPTQAQVKEITLKAHYAAVRNAAVKILGQQQKLAEIAQTDSDPYSRIAAAAKLLGSAGQVVLARIAQASSENPDVRSAAVKELTDQTVLANIVKTDHDLVVRSAAVSRLTDPALLADIAREDGGLCKIAEERLKQLQ